MDIVPEGGVIEGKKIGLRSINAESDEVGGRDVRADDVIMEGGGKVWINDAEDDEAEGGGVIEDV